MSINFSNEEEVKEYLEKLDIEYRFGCYSEKQPEACQLLGEYLDLIKKDHHKAKRIFKSNCDDENFARSCHFFANYAYNGLGGEKKNEDLAYEYYLKACSLGMASSCYNAGLLSIKPQTSEKRKQDFINGVKLFDKGCSLNNPHSCYFLSGIYISGSEDKDKTIKKDMTKAFEYAQKACNLDHFFACMNLSLMYKKGEGVEKNEEMSEKIKQKAENLKI